MGQARTVLLVDDEPSIVQGLSRLLHTRGFFVVHTAGGAAAVQVAATQAVDLAVLDYRIPDWRGDVLFESLAAHQPHLRHRTVFITGDLEPGVQEMARRLNCPLLLKPFDIYELESVLAWLMVDHPREERGTA